MFEQNQFNPMFPMPVQQPSPNGGSVNLFGDVTIIHNQQIDPMSNINRQMNMLNNQMLNYTTKMTQYALEAQAMELKRAELELDNKRLNLQQVILDGNNLLGNNSNENNIPKLKQAIGIKSHKISNPFKDNEDVINDVEYTVDKEDVQEVNYEIKPQNIINPSKYSQFIDLSKYFTKDYELDETIKQTILTREYTNFIGEGGTKPVVIFSRYNLDNESIYSWWRKIIRSAYSKLVNSVISKVNFIIENTPIILFLYDKSLFKTDIICIIPMSESEFINVNLPNKVENYELCKEFRSWIEDNNPLITSKRVNSVYIFAEPLSVDKLKRPINSDKRLENIDIVSIFSNNKYSIPMSDLCKKYTSLVI